MTETTTSRAADRGSSLASMLLPELKQLAQQLGITGSSGMRKQDLIAAISERQKQGGAPRRASRASAAPAEAEQARSDEGSGDGGADSGGQTARESRGD